MFRPSDSLKKLTIFLGKELSYNQFDGIYLFLSELALNSVNGE